MQGAGEQNLQSDTSKPNGAVKKGQSVGLRWLTAVIAMPIVLTFVWFGGWSAFAATVFVVVLAVLELHTMLLHRGYHPLIWVSLCLSILFLIAAMFPLHSALILQIGLGGAILLSFPWLFFRKRLEGALIDWALTLAISIYLGLPMSFFLVLRGYDPGKLSSAGGAWLALPPGGWWLLVVLLGVWGFDGAAFFAGRYFGRHRLAPHISQGKTWEGVIGGMVLSVTASLLLTIVPLGVPWYLAVTLGVLLGVSAVLGDLAESLIKRQVHVKDSGQIMPGHGGILDRIDSLLFAVVIVYMFVQLIHIVGI